MQEVNVGASVSWPFLVPSSHAALHPISSSPWERSMAALHSIFLRDPQHFSGHCGLTPSSAIAADTPQTLVEKVL